MGFLYFLMMFYLCVCTFPDGPDVHGFSPDSSPSKTHPRHPPRALTLLQPLQGDPWWRRRPHHQARVLLASLSDGTQWCHVILDNDNNNNDDNGSQ